MVSEASQLRAIDVALSLARGRIKKLTPAELQIFERDLEAIRARIVAATANRNASQGAR